MTVTTRPTLVIAEIGSCHDRSLTAALNAVDVAKGAGADVIKYQFWSSVDRMVQRRNAEAYRGVYERYKMPSDWLPSLAECARDRGLIFACSSYLPEDVWRVAEHATILKVSSFESQDRELLVAHIGPVAAGRRLLISLGMDGRQTIANEWLMRGLDESARSRVDFLACTSAYPAPTSGLMLHRIRDMSCWGRGEKPLAGYSDHSWPEQTWTGALAVACGARIIERHLRLDDTDRHNPDYNHSSSPAQFGEYVQHIRYAEYAIGEPQVGPHRCEEPMLAYRAGVEKVQS